MYKKDNVKTGENMHPPKTEFLQFGKLNLSECLAKTVKLSSTKSIKGVNVLQHCIIVGKIAKELINRSPLWLQNSFFPPGSELVAASHDIGKISPGFQQKIYDNLKIPKNITSCSELDKNIGWHGAVSQSVVVTPNNYIPKIIGRHHGNSPAVINIGSPNDEKYGGKYWQKLRERCLTNLKSMLKSDWPQVKDDLHADVLSGLTSVADWIGSGPIFDSTQEFSESLIKKAVDKAGFVQYKINKGLSFQDIFSFSARKAQIKLINSINSQGVFVLESPTGSGKTEAALYAAYKAIERKKATGFYFALPTQLTSNKIIDRVNNIFLKKILNDKSLHKQSLLLHGTAWLKKTELGGEGSPGFSWFNSNKRGLLAPFAVGTLDQVLMAVMNVKHGFVRTFGLAGKVVILDEVHSYDSYTGTLLDYLIRALKNLHCTVIILSATLTRERRNQILGVKKSEPESIEPYPMISSFPNNSPINYKKVDKTEDWTIKLKMTSNSKEALEEALLRAERGEQVLWVENTVSEAQNIYQVIGARTKEMGVECGLLHSRFLRVDREKNEDYWVTLYGKFGYDTRRNKGRILIGTQVVEQSLDIDADFLVTKLCPVDMVLQRFGRLWRHSKNDKSRPDNACREAWVISQSLSDAIKKPEILGKSVLVYPIYVLCRSLEVLMNRDKIILPLQTRNLIEDTYKERLEKGEMATYKEEIKKIREKLERFALIGVSSGGRTLPEAKIATRYSDINYVEVLFFKEKSVLTEGIKIKFFNDSILFLPHDYVSLSLVKRRNITAMLFRNIVNVPEYYAPETPFNQMQWLKNYMYIGDGSAFRIAQIMEDGSLLGMDFKQANKKYYLSYDNSIGYIAYKK